MKYIAAIILHLSLAWLLIVGLHTVSHLLRPLTSVPRILHWFWRLPLPTNPLIWRNAWPELLGIAGVLTATGLEAWAKATEKRLKEGSDA